MWRATAHVGAVRAVVVAPRGGAFLSCGERSVKRWALEVRRTATFEGGGEADDCVEPTGTWTSGATLNDVDASWSADVFVTASSEGAVEVWDMERLQKPTRRWSWGSDAMYKARWNPAECHVIASCGRDRALTLYDSRQATPLRKLVLATRANALAWNPRDPNCIVVGCEDGKCLLFDVRTLAKPKMIYDDHVDAVTDLAFAPSGREFATASADRTTRIFPVRGAGAGRSRECYHTSRMQKIAAVRFTADASFVVTGSDDANVRVWKAAASKKLGPVTSREQASLDYRKTLVERFQHMPEVRRIAKQRNVPKMVKKLKLRQAETRDKERAKMSNRITHSKPGSNAPKAARTKAVISEIE